MGLKLSNMGLKLSYMRLKQIYVGLKVTYMGLKLTYTNDEIKFYIFGHLWTSLSEKRGYEPSRA